MKSPLANSLILLVVASGTAILSFLDVTALGLAPLETIFIVFIAAIVAIQVVPGLMLLMTMGRMLFSRTQKRTEE